MDLGLLTDPSSKPWLNIVANSYIITGDGSFGYDGSIRPVTGTVLLPAFGFDPNPFPVITANTIQVGTTFSGTLVGTVSAGGLGDTLIVYLETGVQIIALMLMNIPGIAIGFPATIRIAFDINFTQIGVLGRASCTYTVTIARSDGLFTSAGQLVTSDFLNTTIDLPLSVTAQWATPDVGNLLTLTGGWMRRVV